MSKDKSGIVIYGVVFAALITWWVTKKKSNETYSAADIARWTAIVAKVQSGDRSVITPAVQEESKRIKTEIRTRHINKPASITPRDIQMLKLHD
jgi:plastocyanin domain-containing protein